MKKILIGIILMSSMFSVNAQAAQYKWKTVSEYGTNYWICYKDNSIVHGWNNINGNWYYFYDRDGHMAYNTFVDGYYVNSDGAWTNDVPYVIQRIINVLPDSGWIYTVGNSEDEDIGMVPNVNLRYEARLGWDAPDVNGTIVCIDYNEFFVADDGTVFRAPHQAGDTIYQYDESGNIVNSYYYHG